MRQTVASVSGKYLWIMLLAKYILTKNTQVLQLHRVKGGWVWFIHLSFSFVVFHFTPAVVNLERKMVR